MKKALFGLSMFVFVAACGGGELMQWQAAQQEKLEVLDAVIAGNVESIQKAFHRIGGLSGEFDAFAVKTAADAAALDELMKFRGRIEKAAGERPAADTVPVGDRPYVTPEDYGAIGDDGKDDTEGIRKLFAERHGKIILFPGKEYHISDTIEIPKRAGFHVIGGGFNSAGIGPRHSMMGNATRIVWIGGPDKPMIVMHGRGLIWNGVELHGRAWSKGESTLPRAKIGFLVENSGQGKKRDGIGVGKLWFPALSITDCENGFQAGTEAGEHNCDNLVFGYLTLGNCTYGFRTRNHMAMDIHIHYVKGGGTMEALFYFEHGGAAHIQGMGMHSKGVKTLVKIGSCGVNNGFFSINNVKIDAQAGNLKIIQMESPSPAVVTIDKLKRSGGRNMRPNMSAIYELKGSAVLTIRDSQQVVGPESFLTEADKQGSVPNVLLDRCDMPAGLTAAQLHHPDSKGGWNFAAKNCYAFGESPRPLVDLESPAPEKTEK